MRIHANDDAVCGIFIRVSQLFIAQRADDVGGEQRAAGDVFAVFTAREQAI